MEEVELLFLEEALELLAFIEADLCQLSKLDDREAIGETVPTAVSLEAKCKAIANLLNTVKTLARGANQVKVTEFQILITRLFHLLQPSQAQTIELKQLWQTYAQLKYFLLTRLSQEQLGITGILAKGESVFALAQPRLRQEIIEEQEVDVPKALLNRDVAENLSALETAINNPTAYNLSVELQKQAEIFFGLGELLEIADFITIARGTLSLCEYCCTALRQNKPQTTLLIARRALASWRATYTALSRELTLPIDFPTQNNSKELAFASNCATASELTLNAANFFVWLSGFNLFFLAADNIAEIFRPQPEQIIYSDNQQFVVWQSYLLPIYQLSTLVEDNSSLPPKNSSSITSESSLILVKHQSSTPLALEIEVERLVVASQLTLQPFSSLPEKIPNYFVGYLLLEDERMVAAIDVLALLRHHRKISVVKSSR